MWLLSDDVPKTLGTYVVASFIYKADNSMVVFTLYFFPPLPFFVYIFIILFLFLESSWFYTCKRDSRTHMYFLSIYITVTTHISLSIYNYLFLFTSLLFICFLLFAIKIIKRTCFYFRLFENKVHYLRHIIVKLANRFTYS